MKRIVARGKNGYLSVPEKILKQRINKGGYQHVSLSKNNIVKDKKTHQLVVMSFLGHTPNGFNGLVVNHKNFIRTDNRLENLELVTPRENTNLRHLPSTSDYTGVYWHKQRGKWESKIYILGKQKFLGLFEKEEDAAKAYINALDKFNKNNLPL